MKRTEVEELLSKMEDFADFLFVLGHNHAANQLLGVIETTDALLEDSDVLEEDVL